MTRQHKMLYGLLAVLGVGLAVLGQQLAAGQVPIPADFKWTVPIAIAMLVAASTRLPGAGQPPA